MKKILIADSSKASLVMTSEVFKDNYPGVQVIVARTGDDVIKLAKEFNDIDAFIIDFDLPSTNGAIIAAQLKKLSKAPVLITAFDRNDVTQTIESLVGEHEDCKSWLKKPIHPEVVIAVAQRYCEGKIRVQKRIPCRIPAIAYLTYTQGGGRKIKAKENTLMFCATIEDCSINGVKLTPYQHHDSRLTEWAELLSNIEFVEQNNQVIVHLPVSQDIEDGKNMSDDQLILNSLPGAPLLKAVTTPKISKTKKTTKKVTTSTSTSKEFQILQGKIAWTSTDSGDWSLGIEFEDISLAKRLFEATVTGQGKKTRGASGGMILKSASGGRRF